jgi:phosphate starvation-inducible PhoH-like protein
MARKPARADGAIPMPAVANRRARSEITFEEQRLLGPLFGQFDANLVQVENRLGVFISARGDRVQIEGSEDAVARARDTLKAMYDRLAMGQELDAGAIEGLIAMSVEPTLEGIVRGGVDAPPIMIRTRRKTIVPRSAGQIPYMKQLASEDIVFGVGPAGTGKTYLAVAAAAAALQDKQMKRIILCRPAVEAGERLGFLPGDIAEKVNPYLRPLYDSLYDIIGFEKVEKLMERSIIEIAPLAFMRGRTLNDSFIILDEAQNTTPEQMKMFLTRLGFGSKAVVTGDITQVDLPEGKKSGLREVRRILDGVPGLRFFDFSDKDVVRHPLVGKIVAAYDRADREKKAAEGAA